jgi:hypothetical protein
VDKYFCALGGEQFANFKLGLLEMNDDALEKELNVVAPRNYFSKEDAKIRRKNVSDFLKQSNKEIGSSVRYLYKDKLVGDGFVSPKSMELYDSIKSGVYPSFTPGADGKYTQDAIDAMRLCRDYGDCGQDKQIFASKLKEMTNPQELQIAAQQVQPSKSMAAQPSATKRVEVVQNQPGGKASSAASAANLQEDDPDLRLRKTKKRR